MMKPDEKNNADSGPQSARAMPGQDEAWRKKPLPEPQGGPRVRPPPGAFGSRHVRAGGTVDWWSRSRD